MADLPKIVAELMKSRWETFEPAYSELSTRKLDARNLDQWMADWSRVSEKVDEFYWRLYVEHTCHTADEAIDKKYNNFLEEIFPKYRAAEQKLKEKLLASHLEPKGFDIPLRNMRAEADLFRTENIPLLTEEEQTYANYEKIMGSQSVQWEGKELTISQLRPIFQDTDRSKREKAWRLGLTRQLADRDAINQNWQKLLAIRLKIARNANKPDYRAYRWQFMLRFDYTPEDAKRFGDAIEKAVVPAARRIYEKRRKVLGLQTLRPWDLDVDPLNQPPLRPFKVKVVNHEHPITQGIQDFMVNDEQHYLTYDKDPKDILLRSENIDGLEFETYGTTSISGWAYDFGKGRVAFTAVGHTLHALWRPEYYKIQKNTVRWLLQRS